MKREVERFLKAIGYPTDELPPGEGAVSLKVDGRAVLVCEAAGRLVLSCVVVSEPDEETVVRFAGYAAGRLLKEEAVLAWDQSLSALILWQDVPAASDEAVLRRFFEVFATSADWWFARALDDETVSRIPEMMIRP